ncbi:MAG TPA: lytic murein transglycosylase, partial [Arenimonas sp.]|nr:lytic murein transglycosylase [Arenimonas sp.]
MRIPALPSTLLLALAAGPVAAGDDLSACLAGLQPRAQAAGVRAEVFREHTRDLASDPSVLEALDYQPEFRTPIWDYLAGLVDAERVADGRAMLEEHAALLARIEAEHGVDPATVVAVWGVESDFGRTFGSKALLRSLA